MVSGQTRTLATRALTGVLTVALLVALSGVIYLAITPYQQADAHTEFYVLGPDGVAEQYPTNLTVDEEGEFIVGTTNNEHQEMTYTVVVESEDTRFAVETFTLGTRETLEERVTIAFESPGTYRVDIHLYRGESIQAGQDPYRELWLDVEVGE